MIAVLIAILCAPAHAGGTWVASRDRIEADLRALVGADPITTASGEVTLESRNIHHPHNAHAAEWVADRFRDIDGLDVWTEAFDADGETGLENIIAELPARHAGLPPLVIGAHFDSTAQAEAGYDPATDPAPGADDDASGVSAILEIARMFAGHHFRHPIRFVAFNAEEEGLLGSEHYVAQLDGQPVRLMYSLDPIGYNPADGGLLWAAYDARWPTDAEALEALAAETGTLTVQPVDAGLIGDPRSDHGPFLAAGLPAMHLASFPQPPSYHTSDDTLEVVDLAYLERVTNLVAAHAADAAGDLTGSGRPRTCAHVPGAPVASMLALLIGLMRRRH